ncbi:hypothetical protein UE98_19000 [Burkholderia cenocepacia]|nr:hypothetical protein UE98_19000 [Burkholderia cenocepacia]
MDIRMKMFTLSSAAHIEKLHAIRTAWHVSNRKASAIIVEYMLGVDTVTSATRKITLQEEDAINDTVNIFLPMTSKQFKQAQDIARQKGYDFTTIFKMALDDFYALWIAGKLDLNKSQRFAEYVRKHDIKNERKGKAKFNNNNKEN